MFIVDPLDQMLGAHAGPLKLKKIFIVNMFQGPRWWGVWVVQEPPTFWEEKRRNNEIFVGSYRSLGRKKIWTPSFKMPTRALTG